MAIAVLMIGSLLSLFNKVGKPAFIIPSPFSKRPFEFTTGFRRTYWLFVILLTITLISIYYHNLNLGIFCLICLFMIFMTFYTGREPIFYVWIHADSPKLFLRKKLKTALLYSFLSSLVIAVPLICFNPANIYIIVTILAIGLLDILLIVIAVYSNYPVQLNLIQNIQIAMAIAFPPFLLYAIPNLYSQAIRRLNVFLK
jgi:hypothetical protein